MAGQDWQPSNPSDEMLRRMMQQEHLRQQRRIILQQPAEPCPRCDSVNTKFAYFNNMKETQPRYFCKGCRRLWTKGGKLRNVPARPARASSSTAGLMLRPVTSQSFLVGSAGKPPFSAGPHPQAPAAYNIQPPPNVIPNLLNPFMDNNIGGSFFAGPSYIHWLGHFPGHRPLN